MDINILAMLNLLIVLSIPIAIVVFIIKSLSNQNKIIEQMRELSLKVDRLSEKIKSE